MIDDLKVAISEKDIPKSRNILVSELLGTNYPYEVFTDAMSLAEECNIFDEHNSEELISDPKFWTEDYLVKLVEGLNSNFSKERFLKTYYVTRKLEKDENKNEKETCPVEVSKEYKDFLFLAKAGAAVIGVAAVGLGIWCYKNKKK